MENKNLAKYYFDLGVEKARALKLFAKQLDEEMKSYEKEALWKYLGIEGV